MDDVLLKELPFQSLQTIVIGQVTKPSYFIVL